MAVSDAELAQKLDEARTRERDAVLRADDQLLVYFTFSHSSGCIVGSSFGPKGRAEPQVYPTHSARHCLLPRDSDLLE